MPDNVIGVSARLQGAMNVQLVMEALGGGGHRTVAGAQLHDMDMDVAMIAVKRAANDAAEQKKKEEAEA